MFEGKFLRTKGGITYFGRVKIEFEYHDFFEVVSDLSENQNDGKASISSNPNWVKAAIEGIWNTIEVLRKKNTLKEPIIVTIKEVQGTSVDTTPDCISVASSLALLNAFGIKEFDVIFEERGKLKVQ
jgi:hypothetical protein